MTILSEDFFSQTPPLGSRDQLRLDRQARVGILRNPKEPPRLPPRRAALTGKWLDLRSRRRLRRQGLEPALLSAVTDADAHAPLLLAENGRIARIDIDRLMAEAEVHGGANTARKPFAQGFRAGAECPADNGDPVAARLRQSLRDLETEAEHSRADDHADDPLAVSGAMAAADAEADQLSAPPRRALSGLRRVLRRGVEIVAAVLAGLAFAGLCALVAHWALPLLS